MRKIQWMRMELLLRLYPLMVSSCYCCYVGGDIKGLQGFFCACYLEACSYVIIRYAAYKVLGTAAKKEPRGVPT